MMGSSGGDSQQRREAVLAEYEVLASVYLSIHRSHEATGRPRSEMPLHLAKLLPVYDGWCFSPEWEAPRPVEHWGGKFQGQHDALEDILAADDRRRLRAIEDEILRRSVAYRLLSFGEQLVRRASDEAARELAADLRPIRQANHVPRDEPSVALGEALTRLDSVSEAEFQANLGRLRLVWLLAWRGLVRAQVRGLRAREGVHSRRYKVERATTSENLEQAYEIFGNAYPNKEGSTTDAFGRWYLTILGECAATKDDEERIRRSNAKSVLRRAPKVLTPERMWGRVARRRLKNHLDYDLRS